MSSIQDRIRRLESGGAAEESAPPSGAVAKAKEQLSRSSVDNDAGGANRSVSNIASRFAAPKSEPDAPRPPKVAELRQRVAAASADKPTTVSARAAALASSGAQTPGGAQVSARRDALQARAGERGGVAARAGRFEKAVDEDSSRVAAGLVSLRSEQLDQEKANKSAPTQSHDKAPPTTPLSSRAAMFEKGKSALAAETVPEPAKQQPSRVAAVTAAFSKQPEDDGKPGKAEQPKLGKVASAAKDRELHDVREELADILAVSKDLLSELARLRGGMREMEVTRDALMKRVEKLERKAK